MERDGVFRYTLFTRVFGYFIISVFTLLLLLLFLLWSLLSQSLLVFFLCISRAQNRYKTDKKIAGDIAL